MPLAKSLTQRKLTLCGTVRKNKPDLPPIMQANKIKPVFSSIFAFKENITLVSYVSKKSKAVIVLSTEHHDDAVSSEGDNYKPDIILHYNKTKGAVDTLDRINSEYSVKRSTRRWPMVVLYNIIDIACNNAFVCYISKFSSWKEKAKDRRKLFLLELGRMLALPHVRERRKACTGIHKRIISNMDVLLGNVQEINSQQEIPAKLTGRCYICPRNADRKSRNLCSKCKKFACKTHSKKESSIVCNNC